MASLYWLEAALAGFLPTLWLVLGVGLPWAFAILPTRDWQSRPLVAALALALGPAWLSAWLLLLGSVGAQSAQPLITAEWILLGSSFIALAGIAIAWRKRQRYRPRPEPPAPVAFDEKLLIALIGGALLLRWLHTAFWPFTAYDALWVYGYQGKLYFLEGNIPQAIGYYPPFLQLQFTYVQTLIGAINDQAARMVLPPLHIGSVLAAYLLGARLCNRRVGLFTAALWSLHPHVGQWAYVADLEIPLTFSFTLAAVFLLSAWQEKADAARRRGDALRAGLLLGIALFTKPTAGAFIWGVLLLLAVALVQAKFSLRRCWPRLQVAIWTGLACLPLGAVWYLRNMLLGHDAITLPKAIWLERALRSGDYLAPFILLVVVGSAAILLSRRRERNWRALALCGLGIALLLAGALASNARLFPARVDPPASYIRPAEWLLMLAGLALIALSLRLRLKPPFNPATARLLSAGGWSLLLALPYFITFFYSYSYHYRLGFAIVPLLCLPTAISLAEILRPARWRAGLRRAYYVALVLLCLPGIAAVAVDVHWSSIWLLRAELDSDFKKYQVFNPSLMEVVIGLEDYQRDKPGNAPITLAPGEERLPFFFPQMTIFDQLVTELAEYEALGATHFVYGAKAAEAYREAGLERRQLAAARGRYDLFELKKSHYDGTFSYELYETLDLSSRQRLPTRFSSRPENRREIIFDERVQLYALGAYPPVIYPDTPITFEPTWRALQPLERDYVFVMQLRPPNSAEAVYEWRFGAAPHRRGHYASSLWQVGEIINDRQILRLEPGANIPRGENYSFWLGVWDAPAERFLPLAVDGLAAAGAFYQLPGSHALRT